MNVRAFRATAPARASQTQSSKPDSTADAAGEPGAGAAALPAAGGPGWAALRKVLEGRRRLLVLTHTNPDPDSLGSAVGLGYLAKEMLGLESVFGLHGRVMRAENKTMVDLLGIAMNPVGELELASFDCVALVDSQPGFGNTHVPADLEVDIVVDHHTAEKGPQRPDAKFVDIRLDAGATSSLIADYMRQAGVEPSPEVATALLYGLLTDTADLSRNTSAVDLMAHEFLGRAADRKMLALIKRPELPEEYYCAIKHALSNVRIFGHVVLCSLGKVRSPEIIAEVADLLLRLQGKQAVFCGGLVGNNYHVSVRTEIGDRDAWRLIRDAFDGEGSFGGHGSVAGGAIPVKADDERHLKRVERKLEKNILRSQGVENITLHTLGMSTDV